MTETLEIPARRGPGRPPKVRPKSQWPTIENAATAFTRPTFDEHGLLDERWARRALCWIRAPFTMTCAWNPRQTLNRIRVHRLMASVLGSALQEIAALPDFRAQDDLDGFAGTWRFDLMPNGEVLAPCAYGAEIRFGRVSPRAEEILLRNFTTGAYKSTALYAFQAIDQ